MQLLDPRQLPAQGIPQIKPIRVQGLYRWVYNVILSFCIQHLMHRMAAVIPSSFPQRFHTERRLRRSERTLVLRTHSIRGNPPQIATMSVQVGHPQMAAVLLLQEINYVPQCFEKFA